MGKNKLRTVLSLILIVGGVILVVFTHLYKIAEVPLGLHADEAGAAYDAFSIATYGVDRSLDSYPLYFTNYGDGQNALYIYIMAVLFRLFGISRLTIRIGIVVAAFLAAYFGFLYAVRSWQNRKAGIVFLYLYAILPIFIMTQRFGLESHLMLAAGMVSVYFAGRALDTEKCWYYFLTGCALGITLYTYALAYIVVPLFLLFMLLYSIPLKKCKVSFVAALALPLIIFALPLILVQAVNMFQLPEFCIGPFTITRLPRYRSDEVAISFSSIFHNLNNLFCYTLFYDNLTYNSLSEYGTMYYISVPFILLGIYRGIADTCRSIHSKSFHYSVPIVAWWLSECIMGLLLVGNSSPNTTRMNGIFMSYLYFLVSGILTVMGWLKKLWQKRCFVLLTGVSYAICFVHFINYYFTDYTSDTFPLYLFYEPYEGIREFKVENEDESWVNRNTCYPWNYVYYMLEFRINPWEMNIPENGHPIWGCSFRGDYTYGYPENTDLLANYVVYESDISMMTHLEDCGYEEINVGKFRFCISPLDNYTEQKIQCMGAHDRIFEMEGCLCLTGWWIDDNIDQPYTLICAEIDGVKYNAEQVERKDVVDAYGKDDYIYSGYQVKVPMSTFQKAEYIALTGITEEGNEITLYEFIRK